ncbi:MAG: hypothetical protein LBV12_11080 [Puniceicoccales bacterium]|jgi:hypothetical protein|nr:hypothetical protein [Puniceicoccales bacterium]
MDTEQTQTVIYQVAEIPSYNLPIEAQTLYASIGLGLAAALVAPLLVMTILSKAHRAGEGANYD